MSTMQVLKGAPCHSRHQLREIAMSPVPSAPSVQRFRVISWVVVGALIPLMLDTLLDLLTTRTHPGAWRDYADSLSMLAVGAATMVIAFRAARYSKVPGVATILLLMALMVITVLLSHFS